ncbi:MAG: CBS domain-containing protein [Vulcanimicrobiaceae bacterium]
MRVSDLPINPLLSVAPEASLAEVARRMRVEDCGSAAVMSGGRLLGIVTERDLVQAIADGIDPRETTAGLFMSEDPVTASPTDDVAVVAMRMVALGIRHLPVLDAAGTPIGMLSARGLVAALESPPAAAAKDASV